MDKGEDLDSFQSLESASTNSTCMAIDDYHPPSLPLTTTTATNSATNAAVLTKENNVNNKEFMLLQGKAIEARIKLYGGQLSSNLHVGVTHVLIQPTICSSSRLIEIQVSIRYWCRYY